MGSNTLSSIKADGAIPANRLLQSGVQMLKLVGSSLPFEDTEWLTLDPFSESSGGLSGQVGRYALEKQAFGQISRTRGFYSLKGVEVGIVMPQTPGLGLRS